MIRPKIAIVTTYMDRRPKQGTSIVIRKIVEGLINYRNEFDITLIHKEKIPEDPLYSHFDEIIIPKVRLPKFSGFFSELWFYLTTKRKFDIIYFSYSRLYPIFWLAPAKKIVYMAMDGGPDTAGYKAKRGSGKGTFSVRIFFRFISAFIAISNFGKKGIEKAYNVTSDKVHVVYVAVDKIFKVLDDKTSIKRELDEKYGIKFPFILDVSRFDPHKNIEGVIEAYKKLIDEKNIKENLVFIGGKHIPDYSKKIDGLISKYSLQDRIIVAPFVDEEDLVKIYNAAELLIFPSFYEGFGLPVVEAMATGTPVVTSNVSSLPEVASGAAELVDPYDVESIANGIYKVLKNKAYRELLVKRGLLRAKDFSWEKSAKKLVDIFYSLI